MRSLFIGRYQPFHEGHKALIRKVLEQGKKVLIALRETEVDQANPYSFEERVAQIRKVFRDEDQVKIISIPDIEDVCYGRGVGWGIKEIKLDECFEKISATGIRDNQILWISGQMGSGKTTLALRLKRDKTVILDGDMMRRSISSDLGLSKKDRTEHNLRVARLALELQRQNHEVIVATIAPYQELRDKIDEICKPRWIFLKGGADTDKTHPYED